MVGITSRPTATADALAGLLSISPERFKGARVAGAPLVLRLTTILEQIDQLEAKEPAAKGTVLDELKQRRARQGQAARPSRAAK